LEQKSEHRPTASHRDAAAGLAEVTRWKGTFRDEDFEYRILQDVDAAQTKFVGCNFRHARMSRVYLRNATFEDCKFVGSIFNECNLRGARFKSCDVSYAQFDRTHVSHSDLFNQLPVWPNTRRELARTLRKNAESLGDYQGMFDCFWYEMEQAEVHLLEAAKGREQYYRDKYPGVIYRARFWIRYYAHRLDAFVWGHGESPLRVLRTTLIAWLMLILCVMYCGSDVGGPDFFAVPRSNLVFSIRQATFLLLNQPDTGYQPGTEFGVLLRAIASILGYTMFGLIVATITRRYVRR
jgi:hypothetical protein